MKFSTALSALLLALPLVEQAAAATVPRTRVALGRRAGNANNHHGKNGGGNGNNGNGSNNNGGGNNNNGNGNGNNNNGGGGDGGDDGGAQSSLTLDPSQVQTGLEQDGQGANATAGQVPSLTSPNNFINFCLTQSGVPLTNGTQIQGGSCNPTIMGRILATTAMPSAKFQNPANLDTIAANQDFTIDIAVSNLDTGNFVNADTNYFAAPAQVNDQGILIAHSHVVVEAIDSLTTTTVTDPTQFKFFKGLNAPAVNGVLSTTVTGGLPAGVYRAGTINTAANHQPALVSVAQHGMLDDIIYFTVSDNGGGGNNGGNNGNNGGNGTGNDGGDGNGNGDDGNNDGGDDNNDANNGGNSTTTATGNNGNGQNGGNAKGTGNGAQTGGQGQNGGNGQKGGQGQNGKNGGGQGRNDNGNGQNGAQGQNGGNGKNGGGQGGKGDNGDDNNGGGAQNQGGKGQNGGGKGKQQGENGQQNGRGRFRGRF